MLFGLHSGHILVARTSARIPSVNNGVVRSTTSGLETPMNTFPASEERISDVERGRSCRAIVSLPRGETIASGDTVLFAHSFARPGQQPEYVKGGDSVLVVLTDVFDLGKADPASGEPLIQLSWKPLGQGQGAPPAHIAKRSVRHAAQPED